MRIDKQTKGGSDLGDIGHNNMLMVLLSKPSSCPAVIIITANSRFILITHNRCWVLIAHFTAVCVSVGSACATVAKSLRCDVFHLLKSEMYFCETLPSVLWLFSVTNSTNGAFAQLPKFTFTPQEFQFVFGPVHFTTLMHYLLMLKVTYLPPYRS